MKTMILLGLFLTSSVFAIEVETMGYIVKKNHETVYQGLSRDSFRQEIHLGTFSEEQKQILLTCSNFENNSVITVKTYERTSLLPTERANVNVLRSTLHVGDVNCMATPEGFRKRWKRAFGSVFNIF